jgi:hypothetical protein
MYIRTREICQYVTNAYSFNPTSREPYVPRETRALQRKSFIFDNAARCYFDMNNKSRGKIDVKDVELQIVTIGQIPTVVGGCLKGYRSIIPGLKTRHEKN